MNDREVGGDQVLDLLRRIINGEPYTREASQGVAGDPGHPVQPTASTPRERRTYMEPPEISGPFETQQSSLAQQWMAEDLITFEEDPPKPRPSMRVPQQEALESRNSEMQYRAPQESSTENMLREFTSQIGNLLQRFTEVSRAPSDKITNVETYTGRVEEDPQLFVDNINSYLTRNQINGNSERVNIFRGQLRGEAKTWIETIKFTPMSYVTLCNRFVDEFDSPRKQVAAYSKFYADQQKEGETAEAFITMKQALLRRLQPNMGPATTVEMVISLLRPAIASRIVGSRPEGLEELIRQVRRIEPEIAREYASLRRTEANQQSTPKSRVGPATPCRWCGEWHYNNQCPRRPDASSSPPHRTTDFLRGFAGPETSSGGNTSNAPRTSASREQLMRSQDQRRVRWSDRSGQPQPPGSPNNTRSSPRPTT